MKTAIGTRPRPSFFEQSTWPKTIPTLARRARLRASNWRHGVRPSTEPFTFDPMKASCGSAEQHRALCGQWHEAASDYAVALNDAKIHTRLGDDTNAEYAGCLILDHRETEYLQFRQELKASLAHQPNDDAADYVVSRAFAMEPINAADAPLVVEWAKQAAHAKPVPAWIIHNMGVAQYRAGQVEGAIENLRSLSRAWRRSRE